MNKFKLFLAAAAITGLAAACSEENFSNGGEGKLALTTTLRSDMEAVSRTTDEELAEKCVVWISSEKGLVRQYEGIANVPAEIDLVTGRYVAEAWAGDSVPASFNTRCFKGREEFNVEAGATSSVALVCRVANVGASVDYSQAEGIDDVLTDIVMTVGHKAGSLEFTRDDDRRGYFMMPSFDKDLAYTLTGRQLDGSDFSISGVIENAQPATEYVLTVKFSQKTQEVGGAMFTIEVDSKAVEIGSEIKIVPAPSITGYGFDINSTVMAEAGTVGRRIVFISSATSLKSVELHSELFNGIPVVNGNDFELLGMSDAARAAVNAAGITFVHDYNSEKDETLLQLNFEEVFTNALTNGTYTVEIAATDAFNKTVSSVLTFVISDAPVVTEPTDSDNIEEVTATTAVIYGRIAKDGVESAGFNWRAEGDSQWQYAEGSAVSRAFAAGDIYCVELTGLTPGSTYEYCAVADGFVSPVVESLTTEKQEQLPNASFEDWCMSGKSYVPGTSYATTFWDSGNHGATTLGDSWNLTTQSSDYVHSGNSSLRMETKNVVVKLAAGNVFVGQYLATEGTNGVLGWGRPFTSRPKALKFWVKYTPAKVSKGGSHISTSEMDQGIVYIALVDDSKEDYNGSKWPVVIKTASPQRLFSKDDSNVIAYGEHIFTSGTEGDGLVEVTIPIEYFRNERPANIILVGSASRYGDFFEGGAGSVMYLDDIELVY